MSDYPDFTTLMQIYGSDIMVPIDLQASYIMMPIDIQAQYVTLEIDIVAQSVGNLAIDIAAQSVGEISIDIAAQSVGNLAVSIEAAAVTLDINIAATDITLDIDIIAQSVGIYSQPEWAAKEGIDKNFICTGDNKGVGEYAYFEYAVPTGKTLYITGFSFLTFVNDPANYDHFLYARAILLNSTDTIYLCEMGGVGGGGMSLSKPATLVAGKTLRGVVGNNSNVACSLGLTVWGYEV